MLLNKIIKLISSQRLREIEFFKKNPEVVQEQVFFNLLKKASTTIFGRKYNFTQIKSIADFQRNVPILTYEDTEPYIKRMMAGERGILWPGLIKWFAKSSGTTNSRSKFIPVTSESLRDDYFKGGKDILYLYLKNFPKTKILTGKHIVVAGSLDKIEGPENIKVGDISAVAIKNLPFFAKWFIGPGIRTTLLKNWEEKAQKIADIAYHKNITMIAGVPSWIALLLKKFLEVEKKKNILNIWPNFELLVHGGVALGPYREILEGLLPREKVNYVEIYNASEGFFSIQDEPDKDDMLLMLDYGIFYEFLPVEDLGHNAPKVFVVDDVELNKNYALIISTNSGLWRYMIGDTIKFTSLYPHKIKITGRTKFFINVFGEEVIVENAESAIVEASRRTNAVVSEFTVGPKIFLEHNQGAHEWVIEFEQEPNDLESFKRLLDANLRDVNSDYDAKRDKDLLLLPPIVHSVPKGTFYKWMESRGKLGGQNKVPRLSNSRQYIEEIL